MYRLEVYRDWHGEFRWRLVNERGHVLANSGENYPTPAVARSAAQGLKDVFTTARVEILAA